MKKPKSFNFSLIVLVLLFVLSQTTFALTAGLITGETGNATYDIEINEDSISTVSNASDEFIASDERAQIFIEKRSSLVKATTLQETNVTDQTITTLSAPKQEIKPVVRYVNAGELNVRKETNSSSQLVATIKGGDKVTYYETQGEWARITTWSDKNGYILAKFLVDSEKDVIVDNVVAKKVVTEKVVTEKKTATVSRGTTEKTAVSKPASTEALSLAEKIVNYAKSLQGVKYVYGGYSTKGFDCSGFTKYVFAKYDISIPRSSSEYWGFGTKIARSDIRAGDIVLFDTDGGAADVSHVGIYVGGGNFIHASTSKGKVIVMNLAAYRGKYMGARRAIN